MCLMRQRVRRVDLRRRNQPSTFLPTIGLKPFPPALLEPDSFAMISSPVFQRKEHRMSRIIKSQTPDMGARVCLRRELTFPA